MARSRRKNPIGGITTCKSEKEDKRQWHRVLRRTAKQELQAGSEDPVLPKDVSDPWKMGKDGKTIHWGWEKIFRK